VARELAFDLTPVGGRRLVRATNQAKAHAATGAFGEGGRAPLDIAPDRVGDWPTFEQPGYHAAQLTGSFSGTAAATASNLPRSDSGMTCRAWIVWMMRVWVRMSPIRQPPTSRPSLKNRRW
jgi:hypothetical protein